MGLLEKIKSILGLGPSGSKRDDSDVGVTVEREGSGPRSGATTATENAVKGTDAGTESQGPDDDHAGTGDATSEEGDPTGTEASTAEETTADDSGTIDEPAADAAGTGVDQDEGSAPESDPGTAEVEAADEVAVDGTEDGGAGAPADSADGDGAARGDEGSRVPSEAVDVIKGIGPTYAGRLSDAGVETVADLAAADADDVAERADVPQGRLEDWIEKAEARSR